MSTAAAETLNMGILLDILDDEWMRDTLPPEDVPVPSEMAPRAEDADDTNHDTLDMDGSAWRDLALETQ